MKFNAVPCLAMLLGCQKEPHAAHVPSSPHPMPVAPSAIIDAGPSPLMELRSEVQSSDVRVSEYLSGDLACPKTVTLRPLPEAMCLRVWSKPEGTVFLGLGGTDVVCGAAGEALTLQCKSAGNVVYVVGALMR